jgi:hypothetical protein
MTAPPLNLSGACHALGTGRTKLPDHLEKFRHCPTVGVPYRFDPEHIAALKVSTVERLENLKNAVIRPR